VTDADARTTSLERAPARRETRRDRATFLAQALLLLTLAEVLVTYVNAGSGLAVHALLVIALLGKGVITEGENHELYVALSVLPLIRILAIAMPFWLTGQAGHFAIVNLPLIVATVMAARYLELGRRDVGLTLGGLRWQGLVALSGIAIGAAERLLIQPAAMAPDLSLAAVWWPALALLLFTGLSEELLFRGVLQGAAKKALGARWGIVYVAAMFGALHIGWESALDVGFVTAVGLYFGWVAHRTGSILGITFAHGIANIMLFIVLPVLGL
jgi:membrane protease YdiL (CAAX protease family)